MDKDKEESRQDNRNESTFAERVTRKGRRLLLANQQVGCSGGVVVAVNDDDDDDDDSQQQQQRQGHEQEQPQRPGAVYEESRPYGLTSVQWALQRARTRRRFEVAREEAALQQQQQQQQQQEQQQQQQQQQPYPQGKCERDEEMLVEGEAVHMSSSSSIHGCRQPMSQSVVMGQFVGNDEQQQQQEQEHFPNGMDTGHNSRALGKTKKERRNRYRMVLIVNTVVVVMLLLLAGVLLVLFLTVLKPTNNQQVANANQQQQTKEPSPAPPITSNSSNYDDDGGSTNNKRWTRVAVFTGWEKSNAFGQAISMGELRLSSGGKPWPVLAIGMPDVNTVQVWDWSADSMVGSPIRGDFRGSFRSIGNVLQLSNQTLAVAGHQAVRFYQLQQQQQQQQQGSNEEWIQVCNEINETHISPPAEYHDWHIDGLSLDFTAEGHVVVVVTIIARVTGQDEQRHRHFPLQTNQPLRFLGRHHNNNGHDIVWIPRGEPQSSAAMTGMEQTNSHVVAGGNLWGVGKRRSQDPSGSGQVEFFRYLPDQQQWHSDPTNDDNVYEFSEPITSFQLVYNNQNGVATMLVHQTGLIELLDLDTSTTNDNNNNNNGGGGGVVRVLRRGTAELDRLWRDGATVALSGNGRFVAFAWIVLHQIVVQVVEWDLASETLTNVGQAVAVETSFTDDDFGIRVVLSDDARFLFLAITKNHVAPLSQRGGWIYVLELQEGTP